MGVKKEVLYSVQFGVKEGSSLKGKRNVVGSERNIVGSER